MSEPLPSKHPWHPVFVHFPIACWVLATGIDFATVALPIRDRVPGIDAVAFAHLLLWIGLLLAVPAIVAGIIDYVSFPESSINIINRHATWMTAATTLFLIAGIFRLRFEAFSSRVPIWLLLVELAGSLALAAGGRAASKAVFEHIGSTRSSSEN